MYKNSIHIEKQSCFPLKYTRYVSCNVKSRWASTFLVWFMRLFCRKQMKNKAPDLQNEHILWMFICSLEKQCTHTHSIDFIQRWIHCTAPLDSVGLVRWFTNRYQNRVQSTSLINISSYAVWVRCATVSCFYINSIG